MLTSRDLIQKSWRNGRDIWVTSDIHGYHKNLCAGSSSWSSKAGCRDFKNQFDMTDVVVDNINSVVKPEDLLLDLGDWAFGGSRNVETLRDRIKCKEIIHIYGNHDEHIRKDRGLQSLFISCLDYLEFRINDIDFTCQHYPIDQEWNGVNRGTIHLFGHRHTRVNSFKNRSMDVGLDSNNLMPYKLTSILAHMVLIPVGKAHHAN